MLTREQFENLKSGDVVYADYPKSYEDAKKLSLDAGLFLFSYSQKEYENDVKFYHGKAYIVSCAMKSMQVVATEDLCFLCPLFVSLTDPTIKQDDHAGMMWSEYLQKWTWF